MRRAGAKSILVMISPACERRLLAASGGKRQGAERADSAPPPGGAPRTVAGRESLLYSRPGEARGGWLFRKSDIGAPQGPRGGVVTQRSAKPCTPVQFRAWPPALNFNSLAAICRRPFQARFLPLGPA